MRDIENDLSHYLQGVKMYVSFSKLQLPITMIK